MTLTPLIASKVNSVCFATAVAVASLSVLVRVAAYRVSPVPACAACSHFYCTSLCCYILSFRSVNDLGKLLFANGFAESSSSVLFEISLSMLSGLPSEPLSPLVVSSRLCDVMVVEGLTQSFMGHRVQMDASQEFSTEDAATA